MWTSDEIKGKILHKLTRLGKFKHSHTSIDNLQKEFPKDIGDRVKEASKELIKEEILLTKPTNYGLEISINIKKKDEIMKYIELFLNKE